MKKEKHMPRSDTMSKFGDLAKRFAQGVAMNLAIAKVVKHLGPKLEEASSKVMNKLAEIQGRRSAEEIDELQSLKPEKDAKTSNQSPPVATTTPTITPPTSTPAEPAPDGTYEAKFR